MYGEFDHSLEHLSAAAVAADASASETIALAELWHSLTGGWRKIVVAFDDQERCGLMVSERSPVPEKALDDLTRTILQNVLCAVPQNVMAIDHKLSASTIAFRCRQALWTMGYRCLPSRVSSVLVLAAHAARRREAGLLARLSRTRADGKRYEVIGIGRPEYAFATRFSASEFDVVQRLVEGASYADIALRRGTSVRTVANQVASAFRRLGVSGRPELVWQLVEAASSCH